MGALARAGLEKLAQYLCRPALAAHRIERVDADNIRISLKNEWRGRVTALLVKPRDFLIQSLAPERDGVVVIRGLPDEFDVPDDEVGAYPSGPAAGDSSGAAAHNNPSTRMLWSAAHKRAFLWDVLACRCGGKRELVAAVQDRVQIERFLRHLGLWPECEDIVAIRGPPDEFDVQDDEPGAEWDGIDDLEPLSWAA